MPVNSSSNDSLQRKVTATPDESGYRTSLTMLALSKPF
jgi:hypothetical protein